MLWEEDASERVLERAPEDIVDLGFAVDCRCLPLDHAYALSQAVQAALPWFADEADAGLHLIHGAQSGNGWYRPEGEGELLYLSKRTRLSLRLPRHRLAEARALSGQTLDIAGYALKLGAATEKALSLGSVLFARHVLADAAQDEEAFLQDMAAEMRALGVRCRKLLCGKSAGFSTPQGKLFTRSLMAADLLPEDAIKLQQKGVGAGRKIGCGLFVAHKDIKPVSPAKHDT